MSLHIIFREQSGVIVCLGGLGEGLGGDRQTDRHWRDFKQCSAMEQSNILIRRQNRLKFTCRFQLFYLCCLFVARRHCKTWCVDSFPYVLCAKRAQQTSTHKWKSFREKKLWKSSQKEISVDVVGKFEKGFRSFFFTSPRIFVCALSHQVVCFQRGPKETREEKRCDAGTLSINLHDKRISCQRRFDPFFSFQSA